MPATANNPRDLLLLLLSDLLFVERQLSFQVIPELLGQVQSPELARCLSEHLEPTKRHAEALERVFRALAAEPSSNRSDAFAALVEHHARLQGNILDRSLADLFHAASAAQVEHYEIAAYRALIPLARTMGHQEAADLLEANLGDEEYALAELERAIDALVLQALAVDAQPPALDA